MSHLRNTPPATALALADAQKATELEPTWGKGWVRLGEALGASEQLKEGAEAFTKAAELSEGLVKTGTYNPHVRLQVLNFSWFSINQRQSRSSPPSRRSLAGTEPLGTRDGANKPDFIASARKH